MQEFDSFFEPNRTKHRAPNFKTCLNKPTTSRLSLFTYQQQYLTYLLVRPLSGATAAAARSDEDLCTARASLGNRWAKSRLARLVWWWVSLSAAVRPPGGLWVAGLCV